MPPHWRPHPTAMEPLDPEPVNMLRDELNAVRQRAGTEASIFGIGSIHYKLGGSLSSDPNNGEEYRLKAEAAVNGPVKGRA